MTTNPPFLTAAETRAEHLRGLDLHMTALELSTATLADVRREIPELEAAMAVFRRLSGEGAPASNGNGSGATPTPTKPRAGTTAPGPKPAEGARRARRSRRPAEPPSFKEFALTHLDSLAQVAGDGERDGGAKARALQPIARRRGTRRVA